MLDDIQIRPGTTEDVPAVIALMTRSLGDGAIPRTREFWDWKHKDNPFGPSPFSVAMAKDQIVGVRVFMRWRWTLHGRTIPAVRAVDTATHPDFQGKGIFRTLTLGLADEMKREGVSFVFNTPNEQSRPGYLKMGWSAVGRVDLWVRPTSPRALVKLLPRALGHRVPDPQVQAPARPRAFPADLAGRLRRFERNGSRLRTLKDSRYLAWRYLECPAFQYSIEVDDAAVIVVRTRTRFGLRELTVCELLTEDSPRGAAAARYLLTRAIRSGDFDYAVAAAPQTAWERAALAVAGFVPAPRSGPILTARELNPLAVDVRQRTAWAATIGDLELF